MKEDKINLYKNIKKILNAVEGREVEIVQTMPDSPVIRGSKPCYIHPPREGYVGDMGINEFAFIVEQLFKRYGNELVESMSEQEIKKLTFSTWRKNQLKFGGISEEI